MVYCRRMRLANEPLVYSCPKRQPRGLRRSSRSTTMKDWPSVAVIVINWNGVADTSECLESVRSITYPSYETIVIDNGSSGDDARVLEEPLSITMVS